MRQKVNTLCGDITFWPLVAFRTCRRARAPARALSYRHIPRIPCITHTQQTHTSTNTRASWPLAADAHVHRQRQRGHILQKDNTFYRKEATGKLAAEVHVPVLRDDSGVPEARLLGQHQGQGVDSQGERRREGAPQLRQSRN